MHSRHDRRMRVLEAYAVTMQRRALPGLVALCESGKLSVTDLTDEELEKLAASFPGEASLDVRALSDQELEAIIRGQDEP